MSFNPDDFMQQTVDQPLETEFKLIPAGDYQAMIGDFTSEALEQVDFEYKKGDRAGQPGSMTKFNCPFVIKDDPRVKESVGRDSTTVDMQIILDIADNGGLDFGTNKNVRLGQIRAAVDQNQPGPWSIGQLRNAGPVMVHVKHSEGKRKDGSEWKRAEVDRVVKLRT
jgi:hypothetical protein